MTLILPGDKHSGSKNTTTFTNDDADLKIPVTRKLPKLRYSNSLPIVDRTRSRSVEHNTYSRKFASSFVNHHGCKYLLFTMFITQILR